MDGLSYSVSGRNGPYVGSKGDFRADNFDTGVIRASTLDVVNAAVTKLVLTPNSSDFLPIDEMRKAGISIGGLESRQVVFSIGTLPLGYEKRARCFDYTWSTVADGYTSGMMPVPPISFVFLASSRTRDGRSFRKLDAITVATALDALYSRPVVRTPP